MNGMGRVLALGRKTELLELQHHHHLRPDLRLRKRKKRSLLRDCERLGEELRACLSQAPADDNSGEANGYVMVTKTATGVVTV